MRRSCVEIDRHRIVLAGTYSMPHRVLPIGPDLQKLLSDYLALSTGFADDVLLFLHRSGEAIKRNHLWQRFKRLHKQAGIGTRNSRNPSPRDLRSTFAIHRLTDWIQHGENLNELVPALSTYMGYASLTKAEQFLAYSPERFREDLCKLSPTEPVKHWREEPELLKFLLSL
jgi:integrase